MSRVSRLHTLGASQAVPRATPKAQLETKLDRAIRNKAARLADKRLLDQWAFKVKTRDLWKDRKTGKRVLKTLALDPLRAEAHHIEPRANKLTRYDVRNGVTLAYENHFKVERGDYRIEGTKFFRKAGQTFIDGTAPVIFVRT
jgi:hypothetical protein